MMQKTFLAMAAAAGMFLAAGAFAQSETPAAKGYAPVNGLRMYYEIYGNGQPLVLLHGGLGSIEMFAPIIPILARGSRVIAVDLQGHGRTADIDRPLSYEMMADDVAALLGYLGLGSADVMGYSLGGEVALQVAIRHPQFVHRLVLVSTAFRRDGWDPEILASESQMGAMAEQMKQSPVYQQYASLAPRPQDWSEFLAKLSSLLDRDYDWSQGAAGLKMPVLIVVGDADAVRTEHTVELFGLLGGGKRDAGWDGSGRPLAEMAILPETTHYTIFMSPAMASTVRQFLDSTPQGK